MGLFDIVREKAAELMSGASDKVSELTGTEVPQSADEVTDAATNLGDTASNLGDTATGAAEDLTGSATDAAEGVIGDVTDPPGEK
ncbi:hypothetical protein [Actinophytocola sp.]|uniref:hypothetical protein n=1 Tax=Actinophytocola sp. TaxID=1872138 RepID=UPI003D6A0F11